MQNAQYIYIHSPGFHTYTQVLMSKKVLYISVSYPILCS